MFTVAVNSIDEYFAFDPERQSDLEQLDSLLKAKLPEFERWFYDGVHHDTGGMRMQLLGYGSFQYTNPAGKSVTWPIIGVALQKNYISVYLSVRKDGQPILDTYRGRLGEARSGRNNFSFETFNDLNTAVFESLLSDIHKLLKTQPESALQYH